MLVSDQKKKRRKTTKKDNVHFRVMKNQFTGMI